MALILIEINEETGALREIVKKIEEIAGVSCVQISSHKRQTEDSQLCFDFPANNSNIRLTCPLSHVSYMQDIIERLFNDKIPVTFAKDMATKAFKCKIIREDCRPKNPKASAMKIPAKCKTRPKNTIFFRSGRKK